MTELKVEKFAQIEKAIIRFGDLTVLVGAQGTGKSLLLQLFKAALDGKQIVEELKDAGQDTDANHIIDLIFGDGMGSAWSSSTRVLCGKKKITPSTIARAGSGEETVFFIPAHRSILISDGWATPFQKLSSDTPVVARLFSQNLYMRFTSKSEGDLFPLPKVLKDVYRRAIDDAIFHGGRVGIEKDKRQKRLKLTHGEIELPFMTWTAGQREFTPLLLGLYHLLPPKKLRKRDPIEWVVVEEPEMGLHPKAISVFFLLVLELLWRGYKVVLSTHSPTLLSAVWMLRRLQEFGAPWQRVCDAFEMGRNRSPFRDVAEKSLRSEIIVHAMSYDANTRVSSKDISSLNPADDDDEVSGWGGLIEFNSRFADVVARARNEAD